MSDMTICPPRRTWPLHVMLLAMLAASLLVPAADAQAQPAATGQPTATGQRVFWCKDPSGREVMQLESCAPGTEVRASELVGPRGTVAPKASAAAVVPIAPAPGVRAGPAPSPGAAVAPAAPQAAVSAPARSAVKASLFAIFKVLGLTLLVALIGYWRRQPVKRWAAIGAVLGIVLALVTW